MGIFVFFAIFSPLWLNTQEKELSGFQGIPFGTNESVAKKTLLLRGATLSKQKKVEDKTLLLLWYISF
jgi:hypothetical protein